MQPNFCAEVYLWRHYRQDLPPIYSSLGVFSLTFFAGAAAGSGMWHDATRTTTTATPTPTTTTTMAMWRRPCIKFVQLQFVIKTCSFLSLLCAAFIAHSLRYGLAHTHKHTHTHTCRCPIPHGTCHVPQCKTICRTDVNWMRRSSSRRPRGIFMWHESVRNSHVQVMTTARAGYAVVEQRLTCIFYGGLMPL